MMHSLYTGATGIKTHSSGLNTIANNLSNVSTVAYKQQMMLFQDLMSQDLGFGSSVESGFNQLGMGSAPGLTRTNFTQGSFEPGNSVTDLAIGGRGFFQVVAEDGTTHYTRAGNFRFTPDGSLVDPAGFNLTGIKMQDGQKSGGLTPIKLDMLDPALLKSPAKVTTQINAVFNIGSSRDAVTDETDPYFALLKNWNGTATPPLDASTYTSSQPLTIYDANGKAHEARIYIDGAPSASSGQSTYEYVLAMDPSEDGSAAAGTPGAGLLMSGTLTFNSKGELVDMSAYKPDGSGSKELTSWTPANLEGGLPQFSPTFKNGGTQNITLDLGVQGKSNAWSTTASADTVGKDGSLLPSISPVDRNASVSTARQGGSALLSLKQDGYPEGSLVDLNITQEGVVEARYTNSTTSSLYTIPLFRFTSEDGLRREGMNHYAATPESGLMEYGDPKTSNYGSISANKLETSNVDMSREMVNMIIVQRGFQMNSKAITTADSMLQKALELKR